MNEPAIEVKDVHVRYRSMKSFSLRKSLGQIRQRRDSYEALRGVSFELRRGEVLALLGRNRDHRQERKRKIHAAEDDRRRVLAG